MPSKNRTEDLLLAWVKLTAIVKNSRITKGLVYNEAVVKLDLFIKVHGGSLEVAEKIMNIIGEEDTARFIGIVEKIEASGYSPEGGQEEK